MLSGSLTPKTVLGIEEMFSYCLMLCVHLAYSMMGQHPASCSG